MGLTLRNAGLQPAHLHRAARPWMGRNRFTMPGQIMVDLVHQCRHFLTTALSMSSNKKKVLCKNGRLLERGGWRSAVWIGGNRMAEVPPCGVVHHGLGSAVNPHFHRRNWLTSTLWEGHSPVVGQISTPEQSTPAIPAGVSKALSLPCDRSAMYSSIVNPSQESLKGQVVLNAKSQGHRPF